MENSISEYLTTSNLAQYGLLIGLPLVMVFERIFPIQKSMNIRKRWKVNGQLFAVNILVNFILPYTLMVSCALYAKDNSIGLFNNIETPLVVFILANLFVRSFIAYLSHFFSHKIPVLWRFHRVHHLDKEVDATTTFRIHPLEIPLILSVGVPLTLLFGLDPFLIALYDVVRSLTHPMNHANIKLPKLVNKALKYFIVLPCTHRIHHSSYQPQTDSNYSELFPVWDIIFGTFRSIPDEQLEKIKHGLECSDDAKDELLWLLNLVRLKNISSYEPVQAKEVEHNLTEPSGSV